MNLSLSLPNVPPPPPAMNVDQCCPLEISQHMHMKEDFLKLTQGKCIKIAQSLVMQFIVANTHVNQLLLAWVPHFCLICLCLSQCQVTPRKLLRASYQVHLFPSMTTGDNADNLLLSETCTSAMGKYMFIVADVCMHQGRTQRQGGW